LYLIKKINHLFIQVNFPIIAIDIIISVASRINSNAHCTLSNYTNSCKTMASKKVIIPFVLIAVLLLCQGLCFLYIYIYMNFIKFGRQILLYIMHRSLIINFICVYFVFSDYKNNVAAQSQCCTEHPELGKCQPGVDDKSPNGKCWQYCMNNCDENKGGFCKLNNNMHHCHCYCWFWCYIYQ